MSVQHAVMVVSSSAVMAAPGPFTLPAWCPHCPTSPGECQGTQGCQCPLLSLTALIPLCSGTWRCGSCVENVTEPGKLMERPPLPVERPPEILGEEVRDIQAGGVEGSICSRCCNRIPTARHCPAPSADPR